MVSLKLWNSSVNQTVKNQFVQQEVYTCISDMAEHLFDWDGKKYASFDEFANMYRLACPHCGKPIEDWDSLCEWSEQEKRDVHPCPRCCRDIEDEPEPEEPEIYEYYLVSPWLGGKLQSHGEIILPRYGAWVWGRQTSGQAILLDDVISEICDELGLLKEE